MPFGGSTQTSHLEPSAPPLAPSTEARELSRAEVGRTLRQLRTERGLAQNTAAHLAGVNLATLCSAESGKRALPVGMAWRLARLYGPAVLGLLEPRALLRQLDVTAGERCQALDGNGKLGVRVPGGIEVRLPREMAEALP